MNIHGKLEAIYIDAWKNGIHFKVVGLHNPPNNVLDLERIAVISGHHNTVIVGDFNALSIRWGYPNTSATGKAVEEHLDKSAIIRISARLTFLSYGGHSNTPDLALTHVNLSHMITLSLRDPGHGNGHRVMYLQVNYKCP
ncbi:hypothetical protein TNCT_230781 [Trichonephila clavata]|uniref:Endonuclease/exonuclease/phosphatase domain-containing protein n=1 Tax=Trichonephila clavata TaxID=2740835 RepID=A0A8X6LJS3_TRICU|nr:hypothetical protein TNCT_230781 [Trichonephila clavata]